MTEQNVRPRATHYCPRCQEIVRPVGGSPSWKWALLAGILMTLLSLSSVFFVGMILMALAPVYLLIACCIGPLYGLATTPPTCRRCGAMVTRVARAT